jgi:hypothetical protein
MMPIPATMHTTLDREQVSSSMKKGGLLSIEFK